MPEPDHCELHEAAVLSSESERNELFRLARSPIGDECQICPVCRAAREYVERSLSEKTGRVPPPGESADESWHKLQSAIQGTRSSIRRPA